MVAALAAVLPLLFQLSLDHDLLAAEDARGDANALIQALSSPNAEIQRQAVRALGRFERAQLAIHVVPFLAADEPTLRIEAANALAQMKAMGSTIADRLGAETEPEVRAALYEALGRGPNAHEDTLVAGLSEDEPARLGAAKGLEAYLRLNDEKPSGSSVRALRRAVFASRSSKTRQLALLALNRAGDRDRRTLEEAWRDEDPLVRRLSILGLGEWRDDPSPIVRYAALKVAPSCARAQRALVDPSEHVALLGVDSLGNGCAAPMLRPALESDSWRRSARALVSLAKVDPSSARPALDRFVEHDVWQARVYAARAAKSLDADDALAKLRKDENPNVVAEALVTPEQAVAALAIDDYGLMMRALGMLEGWDDGATAIPTLRSTLDRITGQQRATSRDPRRRLLERLDEFGGASDLDDLLDDFDPFIADLAATMTSQRPRTTRFAAVPIPSRQFLDGLFGATARIVMKEAGPFTIELFPDEAPLTAAHFAELADAGYYDGLTFHRIAPNFVLQGGSPGANEFEGRPEYIRDEVGLRSHERGTLGISTRGRDTGDSQIFINLVDNFRLDHNYTVFARVIEGMDNVDQIQEGDVMVRVEIVRR